MFVLDLHSFLLSIIVCLTPSIVLVAWLLLQMWLRERAERRHRRPPVRMRIIQGFRR